ncbi:MAG TPA: phosphatase PAP2 family protein [Chitinophagaceae bacterium]|nr:phosphatase PAP2 family protein [Chitinophagaceae bacterium]
MKRDQKLLIKNYSIKFLIFAFLFLISMAVFAFVAHEVLGENEDWFDTKAFIFLNNHSSPVSLQIFRVLTFLGSTWFLAIAYIILVVYLFLKKNTADAIDIAIMGITSYVLLNVLKSVFARDRPSLPLFRTLHTFSFPSGHALLTFIFCSVLIYLAWKDNRNRTWKWLLSILLILLAVFIGISRIVLREHYASDVLAGFCIGFAWVLFSFWVQKIIMKRISVTG